ncbi:MAG: S-layer homology domain-containing protein, partial [Oscillospiraceae bacterium]|nr:S-layer homology domain-containing protein [Oscillospiraceae bacterium]
IGDISIWYYECFKGDIYFDIGWTHDYILDAIANIDYYILDIYKECREWFPFNEENEELVLSTTSLPSGDLSDSIHFDYDFMSKGPMTYKFVITIVEKEPKYGNSIKEFWSYYDAKLWADSKSLLPVSISTRPKVGDKLTAHDVVTSAGTVPDEYLTWQWQYHNGEFNNDSSFKWYNIIGATDKTYTIEKDYIGNIIRVIITGDGATVDNTNIVASNYTYIIIANPDDDSQNQNIEPGEPPKIKVMDLPFGVIGKEYSVALELESGDLPVTWYVFQTPPYYFDLPADLDLDMDRGIISGFPKNKGIYPFMIQAENDFGASIPVSFILNVYEETPEITITSQPAASTTFTYGNISGSLNVAATVTDGVTLRYQWYSNTKAINTGGTAITGATNASFTIPTDLSATPGTYYYYCVVNTTIGTDSVVSNVAEVTVNKADQAPLSVVPPGDKTYGDVNFATWATDISVILFTEGGNGEGAVNFFVAGQGKLTGSDHLTYTGIGEIIVSATKAEDNNYKAVTSAEITIKINFGFPLLVTAGVGGIVKGTESGFYAKESDIAIGAIPLDGFRFINWTLSDVFTNDTFIFGYAVDFIAFKMPPIPVSIKANFAPIKSRSASVNVDWILSHTKNDFVPSSNIYDLLINKPIGIVVRCPVDVELYGANNQLLGKITNNIPDYDPDDGIFMVVEDDVKCIVVPSDMKYTLKLTGTDNGTMTYSVSLVDFEAETETEKTFSNVKLFNGKQMQSSFGDDIDTSGIQLFVIENGAKVAEIDENGIETKIAPPANSSDSETTNQPTAQPTAESPPKPDTSEDKNIVDNGSAAETPDDKDPDDDDDGSVMFPDGGKIETPNEKSTIIVPPGTTISQDGSISFPKGSGGAKLTYGDFTFNINENAVITFDSEISSGYSIFIDNPFDDVKESDWFYDDVMYVYSHGLMNGTGIDPMIFSPDISLTRGMVVTVLYRLAGSPDVNDLTNPFDDVAADMWYTDAIKWAAENDIVKGYGNGKFGPNDNITRQDLAAVIYRYEQFSDNIPRDVLTDRKFSDWTDINDYAKNAVNVLTMQGIINGKPGNIFDPAGNATRAEFSAILHRFLKAIMENNI